MATERKPGFQRPPDWVQCCTCGEWYDAENEWHTCNPMPFLSPHFNYYRARLPADFWKGRAARRRSRVKEPVLVVGPSKFVPSDDACKYFDVLVLEMAEAIDALMGRVAKLEGER